MSKITFYPRSPVVSKSTKTTQQIDDITTKKIGWNFHRMDRGGPWPCSFKKLTGYRDSMLSYEGKTIEEIFNQRHCHPTPCDALCKKAQNRLAALDIAGDIAQLDIGGTARLWGIVHHNIFHLLWIDARHEVYPSQR